MSAPDVLSARRLGRATLARQLLLERASMAPLDAVGHLVGMQAQEPLDPYLGLWSRLDRFDPGTLAQLLVDRAVVRIVVMRGTIHLVTAADCLALHPLTLPLFARIVDPAFPADEREAVLSLARALLAEQPRTLAELRQLLGQRRDGDPEAMARLARYLLPLVHVPPKGIWGKGGQARLTTVRAWLGQDVEPRGRADDMVLRYLAAFGPASVKDMQTWCGLTGLREVVDSLADRLRTFRDESGTELFDIPSGPLPDPDTPAPVRLLPEYDNCLRSHTNRRRVMTDESRSLLFATKNDAPMPAFLVDGFVLGTWKLDRDRKSATLLLRPFGSLSKKDTAAVTKEAHRLLDFAAPDADPKDVQLRKTD